MKLNRLETHDRLEHFIKQDFSIGECCQSLIDQRPFGDNAFYIFAHTRTDDDGVTKRLIWQPRLTKPKAQSNSMLFKAYPGSDIIKVLWVLPQIELWEQFEEGKVTASEIVMDSIKMFRENRQELERKENDDLSDEAIDCIYKSISSGAKSSKLGLWVPS